MAAGRGLRFWETRRLRRAIVQESDACVFFLQHYSMSFHSRFLSIICTASAHKVISIKIGRLRRAWCCPQRLLFVIPPFPAVLTTTESCLIVSLWPYQFPVSFRTSFASSSVYNTSVGSEIHPKLKARNNQMTCTKLTVWLHWHVRPLWAFRSMHIWNDCAPAILGRLRILAGSCLALHEMPNFSQCLRYLSAYRVSSRHSSCFGIPPPRKPF